MLKKNSEPCGAGYPLSQWTAAAAAESFVEQSNNLSLKMGPKQIGVQFQFQDQQDSSSTQSTCQSYPEVANASAAGDTCNFSLHSAQNAHKEASVGSALPIGTQDYGFASQPDLKQPYACIPFPYYSGLLASYSHMSQTMLPHFQGMNTTSTRIPLPLNFAQDEPIYVNAKQYNAILRRRQYRAKLEAQNKLSKPCKPYLHESRHFHALKRARGPGGQFLNLKKKVQETQPDSPSSNEQVDMGPAMCHGSVGGSSGGTCSDITTASNEDNIFHQQVLTFSVYNSHVGRPRQASGPNIGGSLLDGTHHMFR